jgi:RHS repeat-associated protein
MKEFRKILFLLTIVVGSISTLRAQSKVVVDEVLQQNDGTKTYIISKGLIIRPQDATQTLIFSATSSASYVFRMANSNAQYFPPTTDKNFVRTESILIPNVTNENTIATLPVQSKSTEYSYLDGLGRPIQSVIVEGSPSRQDVVSFQKYDAFGRQSQEFLSYAANSAKGGYRSNAESEQLNFYKTTPFVSRDDEPYKLNEFDNSPLNQIRKSYGAGKDWHANQKAVESKMLVNTTGDAVRFFTYQGARGVYLYPFNNLPPTLSGTYPANTLVVEESKDEQGQIKRVYKNFKGQTILSRVGDGTTWFDTNYVYDWEGNVYCVFPPEASAKLSTPSNYETATDETRNLFLENNAFRYEYDEFQRVVGKKVPGASWVQMVYDPWDRLVMTWDGSSEGQTLRWQFTKYDEFNRPIMTGFYYSSRTSSRQTVQSDCNSFSNTNPNRFEIRQNDATGYTQSRTFPTNPNERDLLSITYYDDYAFTGYNGWDAEAKGYTYVQENNLPAPSSLLPTYKGYTTGSKIRVVNGDARWLNSVTYYDNKYRVIQTITENHLNGTDRLSSEIDFAGRTQKTLRTHTTSAGNFTLLEKYDYDHAGRLLNTWQTLDGATQPTLVAAQTYNEAGEVIEKNIHSTDNGSSFLQSVDYRYNIRGSLTSINNSGLTNDGVLNNDNNDIMGMELFFNTSTPINGVASPQLWNGNIGAIKWKTTNLVDPAKEKVFGFNYDVLNRLSRSVYATKPIAGTSFTGDVGAYDNAYSYDLNGNIKTLTRNGMLGGAVRQIDNLSYGYTNGNKLQYVNDSAPYAQFGGKGLGFVEKTNMIADEYYYDGLGNATQDVNKGIDVTYNHMSMPTRVDFGGGNYILYTYDALGSKLKDQVYKSGAASTITRDYVDGVHYENNSLAFITTNEGRALKTSTQWQYEYFLRDHQGNTMAAFGRLQDAAVYTACMETEKATYEESTFRNISNARRSQDFNVTPITAEVPAPNKSIRTNGLTASTAMGPGIRLTVNSGDRIKIAIQARTITPSSGANADVLAGSLVSLVTAGFGIGAGEAAYAGFNNNLDGAAGAITTAGSTSPKAYLNYILFNSSHTGSPQFGFVPVPASAALRFEKLEMDIPIPAGYANGIMYIYVNNESNYNVYFDDMYILHERTTNSLQVTQLSDYYPFGLGFNVWNKESITANRYLYQGQDSQDDLGYNEYQYKYRMHDPAMARFKSVDPLSEKYMYNSTYAFSENRVIDGVELEGKEFMPSGPWSYNMYQNRNNWDGGYLTGTFDFAGDIINSWRNSFMGYFKEGMKLGMENYRFDNNQGAYNAEIGMGDEGKAILHTYQQAKHTTEAVKGFNTITNTTATLAAFPMLGLEGVAASSIFSTANKAGGTVYRAMSNAEYAAFEANQGGLTYMKGKELFVSNSAKYSRDLMLRHPDKYNVLVQFNMKPGAMDYFSKVGIMHSRAPGLSGWAGRGNLLWKSERGAMNLGIQSNTHMFNPWINSFKVIK